MSVSLAKLEKQNTKPKREFKLSLATSRVPLKSPVKLLNLLVLFSAAQ